MPLHDVRSVCLPYCLQRQPDGRYVALNREYKPLGWTEKDWVDYADYPIAMKLKGMTAKKAASIDWASRENIERIYLYNDGCIPTDSAAHMKAYCERLAKLAKMQLAE